MRPLPLDLGASPGSRCLLVPLLGVLLAVAGCPSRELPPPPAEEAPKPAPAPACEKVFRDPAVRAGGAKCCHGPSSEVLKKADVLATCGRTEVEYAGESQDQGECQFHFQLGGDARDTFVAVNRLFFLL